MSLQSIEDLTLTITLEMRVHASLDATFAALLEISGPLFASYPLVSNIQYRLTPTDDGTLISFRHAALGFMQEDHRLHVGEGWQRTLQRARRQAEGGAHAMTTAAPLESPGVTQ
jgi:hypothetical protein